MTIGTTSRKNYYTADGVTTVFPFTFKIVEAQQLKVYFENAAGDLLIQGSGFTTTGLGEPSGGSVTFTTAPGASGADVVAVLLIRQTAITQDVDLVAGGKIGSTVLETALDKLTCALQEIQEDTDRSVTTRTQDGEVGMTLPVSSPGAGLVWDDAGLNLENTVFSLKDLVDGTGVALDPTRYVRQNVVSGAGQLLVGLGAASIGVLPASTDGKVLTLTSGLPSWQSAASTGPWAGGGAFTRTADATFTVADNATNQDIFRAGRPIRFRQNSGTAWMYAVIRDYTTGTVTLGGAALTAAIGADAGREMQYGDMARLHTEVLVFNGYFADGADATLIANDLMAQLPWPKGKAYLVHFKARPKVDDSGAAQSRVNVTLNGAAACTANASAGLAVNDAAWVETATDVSTANYGITLGQAVEVAVDANGTNKDAHDLTVIATWVLE